MLANTRKAPTLPADDCAVLHRLVLPHDKVTAPTVARNHLERVVTGINLSQTPGKKLFPTSVIPRFGHTILPKVSIISLHIFSGFGRSTCVGNIERAAVWRHMYFCV